MIQSSRLSSTDHSFHEQRYLRLVASCLRLVSFYPHSSLQSINIGGSWRNSSTNSLNWLPNLKGGPELSKQIIQNPDFRYQNKSYRIILPGAFRDHEVFPEVPGDSRVLNERRLWFPTSDRLQTWLILSGTTQSRQCHGSTMVWTNLPPCRRFLYFVLLFSTKTAWKRGSKHYTYQRFYEGNLRQTMVDSWYCLD